MKPWFIYGLTDPRDGLFHYVGWTTDLGYRHRHHVQHAKSDSSRKGEWLRELKIAELRPGMVQLQAGSDRGHRDAENVWIAKLLESGHPLTNSNESGAHFGCIRETTDAEYEQRFWLKVNKNSGHFAIVNGERSECWEWIAGKNSKNYGYFWYRNHTVQAHQMAWKFSGRKQGGGLELDHVCRNTLCIRVDHLERVTRRENQVRSPLTLSGSNVRKTHCPRGHELTGENLIIIRSSGGRTCRICAVKAQRRHYNKHRVRILAKLKRPLPHGKKQKQSHCKRGHDLSVTAYVNPNTGKRCCKICQIAAQKQWAEKRKVG